MRFDWTDLRVFVHACETGSMTEAAVRANLTLAAISARIRALEEDSGVLLLRRHARGVTPTGAGEALLRHARLVFHQLEQLRRDVLGPAAERAASAVLLANGSALSRPLATWIGSVQRRHAGSTIDVRESASEVTVHALLERSATVGIVSDAAQVEGLECRELGADPLVLVVPPGHALADRGEIRFEESLAHPWVTRGEGSALHTHLTMQAQRLGRALQSCASYPSMQGVLQLVADGSGVSAVPAAVLARLSPADAVVRVALTDGWARRRLLVCRHPDQHDPVAEAMFELLAKDWPVIDTAMTGFALQAAAR